VTCEKIREQLTAYLEGELEGDRGTAVRGHLRTCEACRQCATDEAALRDGLRALPPLEPPPALWAAVQAQLAAAEVRESQRPAWKRALSRWAPLAPRFGMALGACAAATVLLVWRAHRHDEAAPPQQLAQQTHAPSPAPAPAPPPAPVVAPAGDVSADLAAEPARISGDSAQAATALLATARAEIASWPADRKQAFETRVTELTTAAAAAADGRPKKRAYRDLIRYLQAASIGEEVALR
jgi:anti-sigma factor RsiW